MVVEQVEVEDIQNLFFPLPVSLLPKPAQLVQVEQPLLQMNPMAILVKQQQ